MSEQFHHGVVVGCDQNQEWLLSWWWENYIQENSLPVAFADFGMSPEARSWCEERGFVYAVGEKKVPLKEEIEPSLVQFWEENRSCEAVKARSVWFKKPFALLHCPFEIGLWLDLDCEVLGPLEPIFEYIEPSSGIALAPLAEKWQKKAQDEGICLPGEVMYNSGVIAFHCHAPVLKKWAEESFHHNHLFFGDQDVLSRVIFKEGYKVGELPDVYNWMMGAGIHLGAVIVHWVEKTKEIIRTHGGLRQMKEQLFHE